MHTASSAKRTCRPLASASEYTATVLSPSSLHAQITRSAISPRLAIRTFLNIGGGVAGALAGSGGPDVKSGSPYWTGCPFSGWTLTTSPAISASISFISFMASMMQSTCPTLTRSPTLTKGGEFGSGDR